jgi:hypothetical protein
LKDLAGQLLGQAVAGEGQEGVEVSGEPDPKEGWYSTNSQYSPPYIAYIPAPIEKSKYSVCALGTSSHGTAEAGIIRLA